MTLLVLSVAQRGHELAVEVPQQGSVTPTDRLVYGGTSAPILGVEFTDAKATTMRLLLPGTATLPDVGAEATVAVAPARR